MSVVSLFNWQYRGRSEHACWGILTGQGLSKLGPKLVTQYYIPVCCSIRVASTYIKPRSVKLTHTNIRTTRRFAKAPPLYGVHAAWIMRVLGLRMIRLLITNFCLCWILHQLYLMMFHELRRSSCFLGPGWAHPAKLLECDVRGMWCFARGDSRSSLHCVETCATVLNTPCHL